MSISDEQNEVGIVTQPVSARVGDYMVFSITKVWGDLRFRLGTDDTTTGFSGTAPFGGEILIAVPLKDNPEPLPDDMSDSIITLDEFKHMMKELSSANEYIRTLKSDKGEF